MYEIRLVLYPQKQNRLFWGCFGLNLRPPPPPPPHLLQPELDTVLEITRGRGVRVSARVRARARVRVCVCVKLLQSALYCLNLDLSSFKI